MLFGIIDLSIISLLVKTELFLQDKRYLYHDKMKFFPTLLIYLFQAFPPILEMISFSILTYHCGDISGNYFII